MDVLAIIAGAILVDNVLLSQLMGVEIFLAHGLKPRTALFMTAIVTVIITVSTIINFQIKTDLLERWNMPYLKTVIFILVIFSVGESIRKAMERFTPSLFKELEDWYLRITLNCAALGVSLLVLDKGFTLLESSIYSIATGIGFGLALFLFSGMLGKLERSDIPNIMKGAPIALITAGLLALAFSGFMGMN
jgi:electron transport complex protein RnfA